MLGRIFYPNFIVLCVFLMSGCSLLKKDTKPKPIDLQIISSVALNPDEKNQPSPLQLDIYEVSNVVDFNKRDYLDFSHSIQLGDDINASNPSLLESPKYSWMLQPDALFIDEIDVPENIENLGVLAHYQNLNGSDWRSVFKKQDSKKSKNYYLYLYIDSSSVRQISKKEMQEELKKYTQNHPEDIRFTKYGKLKKQKKDYSKGVFIQNSTSKNE